MFFVTLSIGDGFFLVASSMDKDLSFTMRLLGEVLFRSPLLPLKVFFVVADLFFLLFEV